MELMVVVTIIGILAAIAIPAYRGYMQEAHLNEAKPYLLDIASKERSYMVRNGVYCCSGGIMDETVLSPGLNVDLNSTGNFCFVIICRDASLCSGTTSTSFIAPSQTDDPTVQFEVWAILRASTATTVGGPQGTTCNMSTSKLTPTDWVQASTSSGPAREGDVVVYRYPAPPNRRDSVPGQDSVFFTWLEGLSESHALTH
jgi:Tfp pilus assembly protein PilE